jgi:hypothetical protein
MKILVVPPQPRWQQRLDWSLRPVMRIVAGPAAWGEEPQQTHFWNNVKFQEVPEAVLARTVRIAGDPEAVSRWKLWHVPHFHLPVLGGWRRYVVLRPKAYRYPWHPGWLTGDACGASRIGIEGAVRLLLGPDDAQFFGVSATFGEPLLLEVVGYGTIGDGGPYCQLPLL